MDLIYFTLGLAGFLLVMGTWIQYLLTIPDGAVPEWPTGGLIVEGAGFILAVLSLVTLSFDRPILAGFSILFALFALSMAIFFYWLLLTQRQTPIGNIRVQVGDKVLPFEALTAEGNIFRSGELMGQRVLFKFFRGGW